MSATYLPPVAGLSATRKMSGPSGRAEDSSDAASSPIVRGLLIVVALLPLLPAIEGASLIPRTVRLMAAALWALCLLPLIVYLQTPSSRRPPIPFLAGIGLLYGLAYALQIALGYSNQFYRINNGHMTQILESEYRFPVTLALVGWVLCLTTYAIAMRVLPRRPLAARVPWVPHMIQRWAFALLYGGLIVEFGSFAVPLAFRSFLTFAVTLGLLGAALLAVLMRRGHLSLPATALFFFGLVLLLVARLSSGLMATTAFMAAALLLGRWVAGGRMKLTTIAGGLAIVAFLLSVKGVLADFRREAWYAGEQYSPLERVEIMRRLLLQQVDDNGIWGTVQTGGEEIVGRSAYEDLFADIVRRTPAEVPYWGGETYKSLIGIFVPRVFWPDKPQMQLGQGFGHRYGYLDELDTQTSYNFPFLLEFYANFGAIGVYIGMCIVGFVYGALMKLVNNPGQSLETSIVGIVLLLPLFNIESDFSLIFGGLFLNAVGLFLVMTLMRKHITSFLSHRSRAEAYNHMVRNLARPRLGTGR